jgi:class 3 adenylate cyclase/tetratricopeptide (TPR) repeat protein
VTSVLFGDLVAFTTLAESRDPEEVRELLSRYFNECRTVIGRYGGTVEKFIGDAVMAVWGVPVALGDDAERAVRAGLELLQIASALGEEVGAPGLAMRVGIVTGEVAVTVGAAGEGMVAGDAVNTASRVQSTAAPGEVWVDETTRSLTSAAIAYEDAGDHALKGKAEPVRLYTARAVVASVGGAQRVDGLEAPMTGRNRELRLVKELFHASEESGRPSLLVVEGEAGVGKSRLAWEFEKYIDGLSYPVRWHRGRCLAYGEGVAFWALAEAVRGRLGLVETDPGGMVTEQLDAGLLRFVPDPEEQAWLRPRLLVLVGAGPAGSFAREDLFAAWTVFFERVGEGDKPVVLVVDDAQHADEGFLGFLDHLLAGARFPVFVVALARPGLLERRPDLATNRRASVLHLGPLGDKDMAKLLDGLVAGLPPAARTALAERADGVPLFAVETVRALIDRNLVLPIEGRYVLVDPEGLDLGAVGAPASLHALVAARLDALAPSERRVVADASVLGAAFTREAIEALAGDVPDLPEALDSLVHLQILAVQADRLSAEFGQYRFEQAVVRQVAYETLSRRDRKARHLAVASYHQTLVDPGDEVAPLVAQHYLDALEASTTSDADRDALAAAAIGWLEKAADRARRLGSPGEGLRHLENALTLARDPATTARLDEAAAWCGQYAGRYDDGIEHAVRAIQAYELVGDDVGAGRAAAAQGSALIQGRGDNAQAMVLLERYWQALDGRGDATSALLPLARILAIALRQNGRHADAQPLVDARVKLAEAAGNMDDLADALNEKGVGYQQTGAPFIAKVLLESAADLARRRGLPVTLARALNNLGVDALARDIPAAVRIIREAVTAARQSGAAGWISLASANLVVALWTQGSWSEIDPMLQDPAILADATVSGIGLAVGVWLAEARGVTSDLVPTDVPETSDDVNALAWTAHLNQHAARRRGDLAAAAAHGFEAVEHVYSFGGPGDDFLSLWPSAVEAALEAGDLDLVRRLQLFTDDVPPGLLSPALIAHRARATALVERVDGGRLEVVEANLGVALDAYTQMGAATHRALTEEDLARCMVEQGRGDEAAPLLARARTTYEELGALSWLRRLDAWSVPSIAVNASQA